MDLVKISAAGGMAFMAALVLVSTGARGRAEPVTVELHPTLPPDSIQQRIDDAHRATTTVPAFALTGPLFPREAVHPPVLPDVAAPVRWPPPRPSVDAWSPYIEEAAARFGVPVDWVRGVMHQESGGRTMLNGRPITSSAGALGLMQVMPGTFAELSARYGLGPDPHDPRANIHAGAAYLREMYDRFGPRYFLAAYNAGPARVDAHLRHGATLPLETRNYTAALLPRLVPSAALTPVSVRGGVEDLTSVDNMKALASSSSRPSVVRRVDHASAPMFAAGTALHVTPRVRQKRTPGDGLFVTLSGAGFRQEASAGIERAD